MRPIHKDPIVEEIRDHAEALADRFNGDLRKLFEYYRERQKTSGLTIVDRSALTQKKAKPRAVAHRVRAPKRP